ncbi:metal ABC transporter ATP-binding protein [Campylobacter sp. MIT 12-5580]|uniref:metal ABC transporter ATP-binding protein n=1 Tax=Campylobacter sp. MIT 12-5580 TaxID=2040651 RepID=UPI0010F5136C|nr:ABC transporter ATP-binding protein [Campylobacter sp. MIT 12-5580]TKX30311.1 metal ABC transporter ATP-binding protein [Campylobacter sp. MIT 12-5580]
MKLFELSKLNYAYDKEMVLKDINLSYDTKDFLAIIGPNGGGKSTLIKLILGLLPCTNFEFKAVKTSEIGYVPQNTLVNENFSINTLELVLMGRINEKIFGFYSKKDRAKALEALEKVGLKEFAYKNIKDLSGGQRQRAYIARALISSCKLLILDEPSASLDSKSALNIFELLSSLHEQGIGIISICHDINIVLAFANKIAYLNKELILHDNDKHKAKLLTHLKSHQHFCAVEMSFDECLSCEHTHKRSENV